MDKRIRRNEFCVIGLPRCDFVFSSTRMSFIGYGFKESALEMNVLRHLLRERGVEPVEAGGLLAPGQNAFCTKICSKIIVAQFCVVLLNNDVKDDIEMPNANVNMEYGLMLGFNKYVIPFQKEAQALPFNVAGLDTVKYKNESFETKASKAIDVAIRETTQEEPRSFNPDQILEAFLLSQRLLIVPLATEGDRNLYELGRPLGFNMLTTFDGMQYAYFGNFTTLRPEAVIWRVRTLEDIILQRIGSLPQRVKLGLTSVNPSIEAALQTFLQHLKILLLVTSDDDRDAVLGTIKTKPTRWPTQVLSLNDISEALQGIG